MYHSTIKQSTMIAALGLLPDPAAVIKSIRTLPWQFKSRSPGPLAPKSVLIPKVGIDANLPGFIGQFARELFAIRPDANRAWGFCSWS
jgi:hypothetical protein